MPATDSTYALFIDSPREGRQPVRGEGGEVRVFRSERKAQEAIVRIGLRKLRAFLRGEIDFDDALTVEEYYLEVRTARGGLVIVEPELGCDAAISFRLPSVNIKT